MVSWVTMSVFIYEWLSSVAFIVVACFTMISVAVSVVARLGMTAFVYAWHSSVAPPMVACLRVTVFCGTFFGGSLCGCLLHCCSILLCVWLSSVSFLVVAWLTMLVFIHVWLSSVAFLVVACFTVTIIVYV